MPETLEAQTEDEEDLDQANLQSDRDRPEVMCGMPCFRGTRVLFKNLIDSPEGGHSLSEFLRQFLTVTHEMVVQALEDSGSLPNKSDRRPVALRRGDLGSADHDRARPNCPDPVIASRKSVPPSSAASISRRLLNFALQRILSLRDAGLSCGQGVRALCHRRAEPTKSSDS